MKLESWGGTDIGRVRKVNQDAVGCFSELGLFVVADGMGGRAEGEVASHMAVDILRAAFVEAGGPWADGSGRQGVLGALLELVLGRRGGQDGRPNDAQRLRAAIESANRQIFEAGRQREVGDAQGPMGTTVVAVVCRPDERRAQWAYVGDSRLYRVRDGELTLLTADHTMFGEAYWEKPSAPSDLPHTNRLIRALGIEPEVEVSMGSEEMLRGDCYLLCSDGISGMVKPDEIRAELDEGDLEEAGKALIQRALEAGGRDNASALLIRVTD